MLLSGVAIGCFTAGLLAGALLVRYGMGLGTKLMWQTAHGQPPLGADYDEPLVQESTTDTDFEDESDV